MIIYIYIYIYIYICGLIRHTMMSRMYPPPHMSRMYPPPHMSRMYPPPHMSHDIFHNTIKIYIYIRLVLGWEGL